MYKPFPIDTFLNSPTIGEVKTSPNGDFISYLIKDKNKTTLMIMDLNTHTHKPLTWKPEIASIGVSYGGSYCWSPDSSFIVYKDKKGHLYRIPISGEYSTQLTFDDKVCFAPTVSPDCKKVLYVAEDDYNSYLAYVDTDGKQWAQKIRMKEDFIQDPAWSPYCDMITWMGYNNPNMPWDDSKICLGDLNGNYRFIDNPKVGEGKRAMCQSKWSPKGNYFTYLCDKSKYMTLWIADKDGNNPECVYDVKNDFVQPSWGSGSIDYAWSEDENYIIFTIIEKGHNNLYKYELETKKITKLTEDGGLYSNLNISSNKVYCLYENSTKLKELVEIDCTTKVKKIIVSPSIIGMNTFDFISPTNIEWKNNDGIVVYGMLYYTKQKNENEVPPLLIFVHGGPTGIFMDKFNLKVQYFATLGWNVLCVNYRGSGGYGRAYLQSLRGQWGYYDVEDCKTGAENLITIGIAREDAIAIMGTSAGGYTALMSLAMHPDFYKAGVSYYGITDLYEMAYNTHRLEAYYNESLIGKLPEDKNKYKMRSPINIAYNIKKPVLLFQGDKDVVVKKEQADIMAKILESKDKTYLYKLYEGEGHGFIGESEKDSIKIAFNFLDKYVVND